MSQSRNSPCNEQLGFLQEHVQHCRLRLGPNPSCACSKFLHLAPALIEKMPVAHMDLRSKLKSKYGPDALHVKVLEQTWLAFDLVNPRTSDSHEVMGFGCWVCKQHPEANKKVYSNFVTEGKRFKIGNLRRHHDLKSHKDAVCRLLELPLDDDVEAGNVPPSFDDFLDLLKSLQSGISPSAGTETMGKLKATKAKWCLCEGLKEYSRTFLSSAVTMNLLRDERHKRLQLSGRASDNAANAMAGLFGLGKTHDASAIGLTEATKRITQTFCTRDYNPPYIKCVGAKDGRFDAELLERICIIAEAITIDSASDEVVAATDLRSSDSFAALQSGGQALMPNMRHILRDKAHGSRRFLTRPLSSFIFLSSALRIPLDPCEN